MSHLRPMYLDLQLSSDLTKEILHAIVLHQGRLLKEYFSFENDDVNEKALLLKKFTSEEDWATYIDWLHDFKEGSNVLRELTTKTKMISTAWEQSKLLVGFNQKRDNLATSAYPELKQLVDQVNTLKSARDDLQLAFDRIKRELDQIRVERDQLTTEVANLKVRGINIESEHALITTTTTPVVTTPVMTMTPSSGLNSVNDYPSIMGGTVRFH